MYSQNIINKRYLLLVLFLCRFWAETKSFINSYIYPLSLYLLERTVIKPSHATVALREAWLAYEIEAAHETVVIPRMPVSLSHILYTVTLPPQNLPHPPAFTS